MNFNLPVIGLFLLGCSQFHTINADVASVELNPKILKPFLEEHCVACHGEKKEKGDLRLDTISLSINNNDTAQHWQEILDALNLGDMPPEDEPMPKNEELEPVLDHLTTSLVLAKKRLTEIGGEVVMRRINQREYRYTMEQIFGFKVPEELVPENAETDSYDTVGYNQYFSTYYFERYFELNKSILEQALKFSGKERSKPTIVTSQPEGINKRIKGYIKDYDVKMKMIDNGATLKELDLPDEKQKQMFIDRYDGRAGSRKRYLEQPFAKKGIYLENSNIIRHASMRTSSDPRAYYKLRVYAGLNEKPHELRKYIEIKDSNKSVDFLKVKGTLEEPQSHEVMIIPNYNQDRVNINVSENKPENVSLKKYLKNIGDKKGLPASIFIERMEIEGPFYNETSVFESLYLEMKNNTSDESILAKKLIEEFANLAFRHRSPDQGYLDHLFSIFQNKMKDGVDFEQAILDPLAMILTSPSFLYIFEETNENGVITNHELANRLSHFLWSCSPDKTLQKKALEHKLYDEVELKREVNRMLSHTYSEALSEGFMSQWSTLKRFDDVPIDLEKHSNFNNGIRLSARKEVIHFFDTLLSENLSLDKLIDSDFVMINELLATHYGLAESFSDEKFKKVTLPKDSPRGGMFGQTAFLSMGSNGERSSPIIRGALIMDKFLHQPPPEPPANVPELKQASDKPMSIRDIVNLHQEKAQCGSCHRKMDPIGFGLENFDLLGLWRDRELVGKKKVEINALGHFPNDKEFSNLNEFKQNLLDQKRKLARSITEGMLTYALGRNLEFSDSQAIEEILNSIQSENYRTKDLVLNIVCHPIFKKQ